MENRLKSLMRERERGRLIDSMNDSPINLSHRRRLIDLKSATIIISRVILGILKLLISLYYLKKLFSR